MSTLMLASASGPKIAAATPGLSSIWRTEIWASSLEKAIPVTTCISMISSSLQISVPGGWLACGSISSGLSKLDRTKIGMLWTMPSSTERSQLQHVLEGDLVQPSRLWNHPGIRGVDAIDVRIDVAAIGLDGRRNRHGRGVGTAAAERGDPPGLRIDALEAGDDGDLLALLEALDQFAPIDVENAGRGVGVAGHDRDLPALPGAGLDAHALQHDGEKSRGDLLAGGDDGIIFPRVMQRRSLGAPGHELVGFARHRRDHDGDLMAGINLALHMPRDIADTIDIGDGR